MVDMATRSLGKGKTSTAGSIICDLTNLFFAEVLQGIEGYLGEKKYSTIVANTDYNIDKEKESIEMFYSKRVDGIIIVPGGNNDEQVRFLTERGIPVVLLDSSGKY